MFMIITICITLSFIYSSLCQMLGPVDFIYKSAEQCPDAPTGIRVDLNGRRLNRTTFGLTIEFDSPFDFDENLGIEMMGSTYMDGGYKPGMFVWNDTNACTAMEKMIGDVFEDFKKQGNIEACPFPKGLYSVKDFVVNNENFNVPHVYGDYRLEVKLLHEDVAQNCLLVYYDLTPKNKYQG